MRNGTRRITIDRPPDEVWAAVADITRMGEWSPETVGARWTGGATGPAVGATFEGDNVVSVAGKALKRWTTTSTVTACEPGATFEFVAAGLTTWRYTFEPEGRGTLVTETFAYEPTGFQGFLYETLMRRSKGMEKGMQRTLERLKAALETASGLA